MKKIRVLHLTSSPHRIGGAEKLLLDMARHYDLSRFDVWHCNLFDQAKTKRSVSAALRATGLPYLIINEDRWYHIPAIVGKLLAAIRREKFDVLHLHMVHATIIGALAGFLSQAVVVVVSKHYSYRALSNSILRLADQFFTNRSDTVVAVSRFVHEDIVDKGADLAKTKIIYNGIDVDAFDRMASGPFEQLSPSGEYLLIGCVGNLNEIKGHEYLVGAMPGIIKIFPAARLILIGEGTERARLRELAERLGVQDVIRMPGYAANVPSVMRQFDVYVQPSLQESFGLVLLEAMAAGLPIVASDVDGIPEIVLAGVTGFRVPPRDSAAIAAAVCALLGSSEERAQIGRAGRARVIEEFDIKKTVRSYEQLYEELADAALNGLALDSDRHPIGPFV